MNLKEGVLWDGFSGVRKEKGGCGFVEKHWGGERESLKFD